MSSPLTPGFSGWMTIGTGNGQGWSQTVSAMSLARSISHASALIGKSNINTKSNPPNRDIQRTLDR